MPSGELDRLLDPSYLGELEARPIEEIRAMRAECQQVEAGLSYLRRLVQGRLDIVAAELSRRAEGKPASDTASLIDQLPEILGHNVQAPGLGRLPTSLDPPDNLDQITVELEGILHFTSLTGLSEITDDSTHARASHALGKSYCDVVRGFYGRFEHPPDFVVRPRDETDVERVLAWCASG